MQHSFKPTLIAALLAATAPAWADNAAENEGGSAELESIQITARNRADRTRLVQPVVPPAGALTYPVGELPTVLPPRDPCPAAIIDRSVELPRETMALPVIRLVEAYCCPPALDLNKDAE